MTVLPEISIPIHEPSYSTRSSNELTVPHPRTDAIKMSFYYQIPKIWNAIPNEIKSSANKSIFKSRYKKYLLNNPD